jgi:hypothetical protein
VQTLEETGTLGFSAREKLDKSEREGIRRFDIVLLGVVDDAGAVL